VVVSLPASPETIGWIGEADFRLMKRSAYLINVARGEIVDEDASITRWRGGRSPVLHSMSGIIIRASRSRPPRRRAPFHAPPNVLMTPHLSGCTDGSLKRGPS